MQEDIRRLTITQLIEIVGTTEEEAERAWAIFAFDRQGVPRTTEDQQFISYIYDTYINPQ